jgi:hypothetical protein
VSRIGWAGIKNAETAPGDDGNEKTPPDWRGFEQIKGELELSLTFHFFQTVERSFGT